MIQKTSTTLVMSCLAATLCGWPIVQASDDDNILRALANKKYSDRQQATELLLIKDSVTIEQLHGLYQRARLPEQRHRLMSVIRHHAIERLRLERFAQEGRGSIGIVHQAVSKDHLPELDQPAVYVVHTFPGFPGYVHLQPGDLILAINDQPLPAHQAGNQLQAKFVTLVQSHLAGDTPRFTIWRQGEVIHRAFALVNIAALKQIYQDNSQSLRQPFLDAWLEEKHQLEKSLPAIKPLTFESGSHQDKPSTADE